MYISGITATTVDTAQTQSLGTLGGTTGTNGVKIFVYGKGVASCAVGSFVVFDEAWQSALSAHQSYGLVGLAVSANIASKFGWFQVWGYNAAGKVLASCADNAAVYTTATTGSLDDTASPQTLIAGATPRAAVGGSAGTVAFSLAWPTAAAYGAAAA